MGFSTMLWWLWAHSWFALSELLQLNENKTRIARSPPDITIDFQNTEIRIPGGIGNLGRWTLWHHIWAPSPNSISTGSALESSGASQSWTGNPRLTNKTANAVNMTEKCLSEDQTLEGWSLSYCLFSAAMKSPLRWKKSEMLYKSCAASVTHCSSQRKKMMDRNVITEKPAGELKGERPANTWVQSNPCLQSKNEKWNLWHVRRITVRQRHQGFHRKNKSGETVRKIKADFDAWLRSLETLQSTKHNWTKMNCFYDPLIWVKDVGMCLNGSCWKQQDSGMLRTLLNSICIPHSKIFSFLKETF